MIIRLILLLLAAVTGGCAPRDREMVGTWRLTRSISNGKETYVIPAKTPVRFFDGRFAETRRASTIAGKPYEVSGVASYTVDTTKTPKTIDLEYVEGPAKGMVFHGIYEISGDVMKICVGLNAGPTPARFESPAGSDTNVDFYERIR